jgi:carboxymethylenebutenolidase
MMQPIAYLPLRSVYTDHLKDSGVKSAGAQTLCSKPVAAAVPLIRGQAALHRSDGLISGGITMPQTKNEYVTLRVDDGSTMRAYLARPTDGAPHPGLIVFQEAFGVNAHIRDVTERFGREEYIALAPELYHRTSPGFEGAYDNFEAVTPQMRAITDAGLESDIRAAFDWLRADATVLDGSVACAGYCMGGRVSFLANTTVQVKAAISYYGGGIAPGPRGPGLLDRIGSLHAPILFFWGYQDKHIGIDQPRVVADALHAAHKSFVTVAFSDADHGFFCDARPSYNAPAATQSWALALRFLKTNLGQG